MGSLVNGIITYCRKGNQHSFFLWANGQWFTDSLKELTFAPMSSVMIYWPATIQREIQENSCFSMTNSEDNIILVCLRKIRWKQIFKWKCKTSKFILLSKKTKLISNTSSMVVYLCNLLSLVEVISPSGLFRLHHYIADKYPPSFQALKIKSATEKLLKTQL